jgi:aminoglycoside phosphotransferase (APT) family kinase protein
MTVDYGWAINSEKTMTDKQPVLSEFEQQREAKMRACVERLIGAKVVKLERQLRWRPAWFLELEKSDGEIVKVHVRGDRESDVMPFPELKREADILQVLEQQGIPVPHIYGMCEDPVAIVMSTEPGTRDVATAASDAERRAVARQYIDAIAAMHQLPLQPFVDKGLYLPVGAEAIALSGLHAYLPLYEKHKRQPDPLIEFAMRWLRSNIPMHRKKASLIAFDAGQFLFEEGKITALYDFEFAMIGDPLTDLATMAMRQSVEPMGDEIAALCQYYAEVAGEPLDSKVMRYHHALFATVACMQFVGSTTNPQPGEPHDVYVEWDIALRRSLINVLAENIGVSIDAPEPVTRSIGKHGALQLMLEDTVEKIAAGDERNQLQKTSAKRLLEYYQRLDEVEDELDRLARMDAAVILAESYREADDVDQQMEAFVLAAGPQSDARLLAYLATQVERKVQVFADTAIGFSASHVRLEATH